MNLQGCVIRLSLKAGSVLGLGFFLGLTAAVTPAANTLGPGVAQPWVLGVLEQFPGPVSRPAQPPRPPS